MRRTRGSVTFFMSIVYLTLISFGFGLVEAYRVQYLYAKQAEIGRMTVHNLKTEYVRDIMEEYGLLLYNESLANKQIVEKTGQFARAKKVDANFFQDLLIEDSSEKYYHFPYFNEKSFHAAKVKQTMELTDLLDMKKEALQFAKDRVFFTTFEPLLEKLQVWKKSASANEWIEKKEEIIKEISTNDKKVKRLYLYLDGAKIEDKTHQVKIIEQGINHLNADEKSRLERENLIGNLPDMPAELKEQMIEKQVEVSKWIESAWQYYEDGIAKVVPEPEETPPAEEGEYTPPESLSPDSGTNNTPDAAEVQEELQEYLNKYNNAANISSQILKAYEDAIPKIKELMEEVKAADISRNIKASIIDQMETLLANCDMENSLSRTGNFKYIHEKLMEQREAFKDILHKVKSYWREADGLIREYTASQKNEKIKWEEEKVSQWIEKGEKIVSEANFSYYYLSYKGYEVKQTDVSEESLTQKQEALDSEKAEKIKENYDEKEDADTMSEDLPSKYLSSASAESLDLSGNVIDGVMAKLKSLGEGVLLDEYYFMVFSHFALQEKDELALSGYAKTDHAKTGEIEYLLFGGTETANRLAMIATLFAARIVFNVISLMTDPQKMSTVQTMAAAISGWWSLGIGIAAISAIIIAIWSSLETSADIFMLFRGKRVPIIKTPSAWYTSLSGGLSELATEGVDSIAEKSEKWLEKGLDAWKDQIEEVSSDLTTDLRQTVENEVGEAVDNIQYEIEYSKEQVEGIVKEGLKDSFENYEKAKQSTKDGLVEVGLTEKEADQIIEKTFGQAESKLESEKKKYTDKIDKIEEKLSKGKESIDNWLREKEKKAHNALKKKLSELSSDMKKKGKDFIKKHKKTIKDKIAKKLKKADVAKQTPKNSGKTEVDLREYLGLSYVDYLRIFLLIKEDNQDLKWLRALDLIQQNKQKFLPDFYISGCERKFQIEMEGQYEPTFLPFGQKGLFTDWIEEYYHIKNTVRGGY